MIDLATCLREKSASADLADLLSGLAGSCLLIKEEIARGDLGAAGSKNIYGEEQKAIDVRANDLLLDFCRKTPSVGVAASEEEDDEIKMGEGPYAVCFDPLDGSSLVDVNLALGTIVSVYRADTFRGKSGRDLLAAFFVVYGPRTVLVLALENKEVMEFEWRKEEWVELAPTLRLAAEGKIFAPGNLGLCAQLPAYRQLLDYWLAHNYKLRYSGGMVPDLYQILRKGGGVFVYPGSLREPEGKLRLLFEARPMAFIFEAAGGAASDGENDLLDRPLAALSDRTPVFLGSKLELERAVAFFR